MTESARDLSTLFQSGTAVGLTDGEVLRRAARATDDEAAAFFRMIVERHGPMVLRVCLDAESLLKGDENAVNVPVRHGDRVIVKKSIPEGQVRSTGDVADPSSPRSKPEGPGPEPTTLELQDQFDRIEERLDALVKKPDR